MSITPIPSFTSIHSNRPLDLPPAPQVDTPRDSTTSRTEPLSPAKAAELIDAGTSLAWSLPAGVAEAGPPPAGTAPRGFLRWFSALFDSIRRHFRHGTAVGTYPQAVATQATRQIDQTEAAASDGIRQHAEDTERTFARRIATLLGELVCRLQRWFALGKRPAAGTPDLLDAREIARWKAGTIGRDDMLGLATDAPRLRAALGCVPALVRLRDEQGSTLAHLLSACGAFLAKAEAKAVCDILLDSPKLNLAVTDAQGDTPLHTAAAFASHPVNADIVLPAFVRRAAQNGFDFRLHGADGMTVLQRAVCMAQADAIDRLLAAGVDPAINALSRSGATALCYALCAPRLDIAQKLLDKGASIRLGQIDGLPPKIWLRQMVAAVDWLRQQDEQAGDRVGAAASAAFVEQGVTLLAAMAARDSSGGTDVGGCSNGCARGACQGTARTGSIPSPSATAGTA